MSFESEVKRFAHKTGRGLDATIRAVCLSVTAEVVERTPVLEGRLRGNWFATIGAPSDAQTDETDKTGKPTISRAGGAIKSAPGTQWWLTNNLPYVLAIEYGHSSVKAPAGMVRVTAENFRANLRRLARQNAPRP